MPNDFFTPSGVPVQGGALVSPNVRAEFAAIAAGFDKLPDLTGNAYKVTYVNSSGSAMDAVGGDGLLKLSTTGTPSIAVAGTDYLAGTAIGTTVQAHSANLDEYAAVNPTAAGLALLNDVDAAAQRTTLGLSTASTPEMEAGTEAALRSMSPLLVAQAIAALAAPAGGGVAGGIYMATNFGGL